MSVVPAYLLARLALDRSLAAAEVAGGRLIVVDAIDEAAAGFCARHDFQHVKAVGEPCPRRMVMTIATARRALAL